VTEATIWPVREAMTMCTGGLRRVSARFTHAVRIERVARWVSWRGERVNMVCTVWEAIGGPRGLEIRNQVKLKCAGITV
jgi:hypothetical protein